MKNSLISIVACVLAVVAIVVAILPNNGGVTPTIAISDDGYWVINGEKTEVKASTDANAEENSQGLDFYLQDDGMYMVACGNAKYVSEIVIPAIYKGKSVSGIAKTGFSNCEYLKTITIPDSVTSIGGSTFSGCSSLSSVVIPDSVTSIGESAFSGCSGLNSVVIPDSVTSIGGGVFAYCSGLSSVVIPDSVTYIDDRAFSSCSSLEDVYYTGSEAEWNAITIGSYNDDLYGATIHYNCVPEN